MCPIGGSLSVSLGKTAAGLINNLLHADQKIVGQNKTYHGHKVILNSRSKKWVRIMILPEPLSSVIQ